MTDVFQKDESAFFFRCKDENGLHKIVSRGTWSINIYAGFAKFCVEYKLGAPLPATLPVMVLDPITEERSQIETEVSRHLKHSYSRKIPDSPAETSTPPHTFKKLVLGDEIDARKRQKSNSLERPRKGEGRKMEQEEDSVSYSLIDDPDIENISHDGISMTPRIINSTALALIPEQEHPNRTSQLCPISCCNVLNK
ncbi:hypothetical protein AgCh_023200 [Apium graveolens]